MNRLAKASWTMAALGLLIVVVFLISMNTGVVRLSPLDVLRTLFGSGTDRQQLILFDFRLPRIVISILIGAGFAVSGCVLQGLTRNVLAEPGIIGINSGAGLAVVIFISFYPDNATAPVFVIPALAFAGASLAALIIYAFANKPGEGFSTTNLLLVGIAVAAGISSLMLVLTIRMDPADYQFVTVWLAGSIWGTTWRYVGALLPWLLALFPLVYYKSRVLNMLHLDEQTVRGFGVAMKRERLILWFVAVALAGSCVAVGGGIAFVGLIAPHLARRFVGPQHQYLLPASALLGALLLLTADTLARSIMSTEVPTGIVVAIIGAPYFLYLLATSKA